jgi:hypothetical protein
MGITSEVKKAPRSKEIEQRVLTVTPAHAEKWLTMNSPDNRRIRPSHVRHLAKQMELGRWMLSPEPIVFSPQHLLDGQHRLSAVLMSGCTIEASVALVQNEDVFRVLDQGVNRNLTDLTCIPSPVLTPLQWLLKHSVTGIRGKIVIDDIERIRDENIFTLSYRINDVIKPKDRRFKSAAFRAAYIMAVELKMCTQETADRVYTDLSHMNMTEWSRMMQNLFHQFETLKAQGTTNNLRNEVFMRALYMFSEAESKKTSIRITEQFVANAEKRVRNRINLLYRKGEH